MSEAVNRPRRPTVAQIREVGQPPSIRGRRNSEHWVADAYQRAISPYLTLLLLRVGASANQVTVLMIATGVGAALALLIPGLPGGLLAVFLGQLQMLWDCCDGEVARWRQTSSPAGVFLDRVGHYAAEGLIPIALGMRAAGFPDSGWVNTPWPFIGALLAVLVLWNKVLNDTVHVARAYNALPLLADTTQTVTLAQPRGGLLRSLRSLARFFPFYRAYHSVELTLLAGVAAVFDALLGDLVATRVLLIALAVLGVVTVLGHLAAILASSKLHRT
jgi:phosphatidylglycerophosphate synthase